MYRARSIPRAAPVHIRSISGWLLASVTLTENFVRNHFIEFILSKVKWHAVAMQGSNELSCNGGERLMGPDGGKQYHGRTGGPEH